MLASVLLCALGQVPLPGTSSVTVPFAPPDACAPCHGGFDDRSAHDSWSGSAMAHAARDPLYLSALTEAEKDHPGVGDLCLRCHAPAAWLEGRCAATDGSGLDPEDRGVTCAFCHRAEPSAAIRNGQYVVGEDLRYRGPLPDPMTPHGFQRSDWVSASELCGTCHDLMNPLVERRDLAGQPMGQPFPEQTTYSEWAASAFAREPGRRTCAGCHLPESEARVAREGPVRVDRSSHELAGGNRFLLAALDFLEPGLGLSSQLALGQARAAAMLRSAAALQWRDPPASVAKGQVLALSLRVTNKAGHKLPTGYPEGRRVWLAARADALALDRGGFDEARGEPVQPLAMYHTVHGQQATGPGYRLALNDTVFLDSRLPPEGFVPTTTTAPVGKRFAELPGGALAHWDDVTLTATVPCAITSASVSLRAALWYQSVTRAYVEGLARDNGADPRGERLRLAFDEADPGPMEIASALLELPVVGDLCALDAGLPDLEDRDAGRTDAGASADAGGSTPGMPQPMEGGCACRTRSAARVDGAAIAELLALCGVMLAARARERARDETRRGG